MHFLCCNCNHRFSESEAVQVETHESMADMYDRPDSDVAFIEYCCPECGSDDVEDAVNLEEIQAVKRDARAGAFTDHLKDLLVTSAKALL